ncbi:sporangia induced dynein heavy chain [Achlya hypogyna]|uniref:Sporangia induced dynein heavy chain n=1 Tax=Achlya hypogyna TaxID=1202772 RepID=A0A1V9Z965_ACHHY|nr:sporangia induced dynein heavy chain [Achlya hypogyna]
MINVSRVKSAAATRRPTSTREGVAAPVHRQRLVREAGAPTISSGNQCAMVRPKSCSGTKRRLIAPAPPPLNQPTLRSQATDPDFGDYFKIHWFRDREDYRSNYFRSQYIMGKSIYHTLDGDPSSAWEDCQVLDYNPEEGQYQIRFVASGLEKLVHRVNLLLPSDDPATFFKLRTVFFQENRLIRDICALTTDLRASATPNQPTLSLQWKARIVQRAIGATHGMLRGHAQLLTTALNVADDEFGVAMRRCSAQCGVHPLAEGYFRHSAHEVAPTPAYIATRSMSFAVAQVRFQAAYLFTNPWALPLLHQVLAMSREILSRVNCFYDIPSDYDAYQHQSKPPFALDEYLQMQHATMTAAQEALRSDWRKEIIQLIQCSIEVMSQTPLYETPDAVLRFAKYVDCLLSRDLGDLMLSSSMGFRNVLLEPRCTQITRKLSSEIPMSRIRKRNYAAFYLPRLKPPILTADVEITAETVYLRPSLDTIKASLVQLIGTATQSFLQQMRIEGDLHPGVEAIPLLREGRDLEGHVAEAQKDTMHVLEEIFERPLELVRQFQDFVNDMARRQATVGKALAVVQSEVISDAANALSTYRHPIVCGAMVHKVLAMAFDEEPFKLVQITTKHAKQALHTTLRTVLQESIDALAVHCHAAEVSVMAAFEADAAQLAVAPTTERAVEAQSNFIHDLTAILHDRRLFLADVNERFDVLARLGHSVHVAVAPDIWDFHWRLQLWPRRLQDAARESSDVCDATKKALADSILDEKHSFEAQLAILRAQIQAFVGATAWASDGLDAVADTAHSLHERAEAAVAQVHVFMQRERISGRLYSNPKPATALESLIQPFARFWGMAAELMASTRMWAKTPFYLLRGDEVLTKVTGWHSQLHVARREFCANPRISASLDGLQAELDCFAIRVPVVAMAASGSMRTRHWAAVAALLPRHNAVTRHAQDKLLFTLEDLVDDGILGVLDEASAIHATAVAEHALETRFAALRRDWNKPLVQLERYVLKDTFVVTNFADLIAVIDDQRLATYNLQASMHVGPIAVDVQQWHEKLVYAADLVGTWAAVQALWRRIEGFYFGVDSFDAARDVATMEKTWRAIATIARGNPSLASIEPLEKSLRILENARKAVHIILDGQRHLFCKLYLVPDEDLGRLLCARDITAMTPHLNCVYDSLEAFTVKDDVSCITGLTLASGCAFVFQDPVALEWPRAGAWFQALGNQLKHLDAHITSCVCETIRSAFEHTTLKSLVTALPYAPLQVRLAALSLHWAQQLMAGPISDITETLAELESDTIARVRNGAGSIYWSIVLAEVLSLGEATKRLGNVALDSFLWHVWPKHVLLDGTDHAVQMMNTTVSYHNDVVNALYPRFLLCSDKALRSFFTALRHGRGLALQGDVAAATARSLAQLVGTTLAVHVTTPATRWAGLGKLLLGAASSGSWLFVTDLGGLTASVLACLTQSVTQLFLARVTGAPQKVLGAPLDPHFVFLSSILPPLRPTPLSSSFFPCALVPMDPLAIAQSCFRMAGLRCVNHGWRRHDLKCFRSWAALARFVVIFLEFMALEKLLVSNFPLRTLRSVNFLLVLARETAHTALGLEAHEDETNALRAALEVVYFPRLALAGMSPWLVNWVQLNTIIVDATMARSVLRRVLPDIAPAPPSSPGNTTEYSATKVAHLQQTTTHWLCTVVSGAAAAGKTTLLTSAAGAAGVTRLFFSDADILLRPFHCGSDVTPSLLHELTQGTQPRWIVLDGQWTPQVLDTIGIFLDEHKNLPTEGISLAPPWRLIIETESAGAMSPATTLSCGYVFVDGSAIGWRTVLQAWLRAVPEVIGRSHGKSLQDLGFWVMPLAFSLLPPKHPMAQATAPTMVAVLRLVDELVAMGGGWPSSAHLGAVLEGFFVFSIVWCIGAHLSPNHREHFSDELRRAVTGDLPSHYRVTAASFPKDGSVFDYCFDVVNGRWIPWPLPALSQTDAGIVDVPSMNARVAVYFCTLWRAPLRPVLLVGVAGCGKSHILQRYTNGGGHSIPCSTAMPSVKSRILGCLDRVRADAVGDCRGHDRFIIFDDVHVADTGLEGIREWAETHRWRVGDRLLQLLRVWFLGAMRPEPRCTDRLLRHFFQVPFTPPSTDYVLAVCGTVATPALDGACRHQVLRSTGALVQLLSAHPVAPVIGWNVLHTGLVVVATVGSLPPTTYSTLGLAMLWCHEIEREFEDALRAPEDVGAFRVTLASAVAEGFGASAVESLERSYRLERLLFCPQPRLPSQYEEIYRPQYVYDCLRGWSASTGHPAQMYHSKALVKCVARLLRIFTLPLRPGPTVWVFVYHSAGQHEASSQLAAAVRMAGAIVNWDVYTSTGARGGILWVPASPPTAWLSWVLDPPEVAPAFVVVEIIALETDNVATLYGHFTNRPSLHTNAHVMWLEDSADCFDNNATAVVARTMPTSAVRRHPRADALLALSAQVQAHLERAIAHGGSSGHVHAASKYVFAESVEQLLATHTARWKAMERRWVEALTHATVVTSSILSLSQAAEKLANDIRRQEERRTACTELNLALMMELQRLDALIEDHRRDGHRTSILCDAKQQELHVALQPYVEAIQVAGASVAALPHDDNLDETKTGRLYGVWAQLHDVLSTLNDHGRHRSVEATDGALSVRDLVRYLASYPMDHMPHSALITTRAWRHGLPEAKLPPMMQTIMDFVDAIVRWSKAHDDRRKVSTQIHEGRLRLQSLAITTPQHEAARRSVDNLAGMVSADVLAHDIALESTAMQLQELKTKREHQEDVRSRLDVYVVAWKDRLAAMPVLLAARLPGACIVAAAVLVYLAPYSGKLRNAVLAQIDVLLSAAHFHAGIDAVLELLEPGAAEGWYLRGLPRTPSFACAAYATLHAPTVCRLLIDPDGIGRKWLTAQLGSRLVVTDAIEESFARRMLRALQEEAPLLVVGVEADLKMILASFASPSYVIIDGKRHEKPHDWGVFLSTPLAHPILPDAAYRLLTVVHFGLSADDAPVYVEELVRQLWDEKEHAQFCARKLAYLDSYTTEKRILEALAACAALDDVWTLLIASTPPPPSDFLAPTTSPYIQTLLPTLAFVLDATCTMGLVNANYALPWNEEPVVALVDGARSRWQVEVLLAEEAKRELQLALFGRQTLLVSHTKRQLLKRSPTKPRQPPDASRRPPELLSFVRDRIRAIDDVVTADDARVWRWVLAVASTRHLCPVVGLSDAVVADLTRIWSGDSVAMVLSSVEQLRRPPSLDKTTWAHIVTLAKHPGLEYLAEGDPPFAQLDALPALHQAWHRVVVATCFQQKLVLRGAAEAFMTIALETHALVVPCREPLTKVLRAAADGVDHATPIVLHCDEVPFALFPLCDIFASTAARAPPVVVGPNDADDVVREALEHATSCGTWALLLDDPVATGTWLSHASLVWQEVVREKYPPGHRLWLLTTTQAGTYNTVLARAARHCYLRPITTVEEALTMYAPPPIDGTPNLSAAIHVLCQFHIVAKEAQSSNIMTAMPIDDVALALAVADVRRAHTAAPVEGLLGIGFAVYASYVGNDLHNVQRLRNLFDWVALVCRGVHGSCLLISPAPLTHIVGTRLTSLYAFRRTMRHVCPHADQNDKAVIKELTAISQAIGLHLSVTDVISLAMWQVQQAQRSPWSSFVFGEIAAFGALVATVQRTIATYVADLPRHRHAAHQLLAGTYFPRSWRVTAAFRMATVADFVSHMKARRKLLEVYKDNDGSMLQRGELWLPAFRDPRHLVDLVSHRAAAAALSGCSSVRFVVGDKMTVATAGAADRFARRFMKKAAPEHQDQVQFTGICVYNGAWDADARILCKPTEAIAIDDLPPVHTVVGANELDGDDVPVYRIDCTAKPPALQHAFSVRMRLPTDAADRAWVLAHTLLLIA